MLAGLLAFVAAWAVRRLAEAAVVRSISEPESLRVYIGPCPYAWRAFEQIRTEHLAAVPLPVGELDAESRAEVCEVAIERLPAWLQALPDATLCDWLTREAERHFAAHFISYPSASMGREPVGRDELQATLAEHGIDLREGDAELEIAAGVINLPIGY